MSKSQLITNVQLINLRRKFSHWLLVIGNSLVIGIWSLGIFVGGCAPRPHSAKPVLTVWHWMTDRDSAFLKLAQEYEAHTGIKVNFELYAPSDAYSQKIRAAAQGETLPDIFGILGEKRDFASFARAGLVLNLSPAMEENNGAWKNSFYPKALLVNEFPAGNSYKVPAGIYGVPLDIMTIQMLYNKTLFKQLGLNPEKPPATFAEFLEIGAKIKAANLQGLVSGFSELWMIDCLASNYAFNIMGKDKVLATIRGEVAYTDADWVKVFSLFKQMKDSGVLSDGLMTMMNKTAEQLFATDKAVFAFNGSWCLNVYKAMNPNLNYGVMLPPKASDAFPMAIWGGAGSSFMVNAQSKNKDEAVRFLQWLTGTDQQAYLAEVTNNLPANKNSAKKIPLILANFAGAMDSATHPHIWGVTEYPSVIEEFDKGIQLILLGEKSPEQLAKEVQAVKDRELAKRKR
jgi:ABC-type glycerol-3-phosphate transport system substrate-binding protein